MLDNDIQCFVGCCTAQTALALFHCRECMINQPYGGWRATLIAWMSHVLGKMMNCEPEPYKQLQPAHWRERRAWQWGSGSTLGRMQSYVCYGRCWCTVCIIEYMHATAGDDSNTRTPEHYNGVKTNCTALQLEHTELCRPGTGSCVLTAHSHS